ncbi:MAG TPA: hypothetical protein DCR14_02890, partial [Acidimicrobiaceae bacterium]|nr:hypothetical protein [Acidimicrobiaceae bacterium]
MVAVVVDVVDVVDVDVVLLGGGLVVGTVVPGTELAGGAVVRGDDTGTEPPGRSGEVEVGADDVDGLEGSVTGGTESPPPEPP